MDVDYTEYLGPGYKDKMKKITKTSTVISNHVSCLDGPVLCRAVFFSLAPASGYGKVPVVRTIFNAMDSIYMPRGGTDADRAEALRLIRDRQEDVEQTGQLNSFLIFPEGTTSNGKNLMAFKKGAFVTEKRI